jgi:hypothetical protein
MENANLDAFPKQGSHLSFRDIIKDDLNIEGASLQACQFLRIGARDAEFRQCNLTQCLFEDTYLRKARFVNVRLTGSTFRKCNLEKANFQGCDLRFCTFEDTFLDRNEIIGNFPVEPNLRLRLARNLRKNFEALGDKESADIFLNLEIEAHEQELLGGFRRNTEYYRQHYTPVDQALAGLKYILSKLSGIIWGYGYRVRRLVISYIALTCVFALITYFCGLNFITDAQASVRTLGFWESIYQSFTATLGTSSAPFAPVYAGARLLQVFERFIGTLFLAMLAASAYRRITR